MASAESPIFARSYDLLRWLLPLTAKFPREQRFVLAAAVQQSALRLHERLIEAAHAEGMSRAAQLDRADVELDKLRHYLRLCHDLALLTSGQYEHVAKHLAEIGRLLGGWRKATAGRAPLPQEGSSPG
jgi:four helix bundle protein